MTAPDPPSLDGLPQLILHKNLSSPSLNTRTWSSRAHPDPSTPLLATACSDKTVTVWDMRDWKLLSTISGGHKRSVRCLGWRDYGPKLKKRKSGGGGDGDEEAEKREPVILATGSFDANCGLWVWNREYASSQGVGDGVVRGRSVPGSFADDDVGLEQDMTDDAGGEEEDEEWHFSTLLTGPDSEIKDLKFSPPRYGANLLATCSRDKSVWVWEEVEPEEWETIAVLSEHTGDVKCVGWCEGATMSREHLRRRLARHRGERIDRLVNNGEETEEEMTLGGRELLASGSYDDTIRLHHDDMAEGDWITISVLTGHEGTVWDLKFEGFVNLAPYPLETGEEEVIVDWEPRLISCSDDMSVRVWKKQLNEKEEDAKKSRLEEARQGQVSALHGRGEESTIQTGFSTSRLPSVIRPPSSMERWVEEAKLPVVHVRSVYAVDWSSKTGLVVSCGGDGLIAVYQEVASPAAGAQDVVMNGSDEHESGQDGGLQKNRVAWKVIAVMEAAHDEYEINHVCWAPIRDRRRWHEVGDALDQSSADFDEYIISTGDDGQVKVWQLPEEVPDTVSQTC